MGNDSLACYQSQFNISCLGCYLSTDIYFAIKILNEISVPLTNKLSIIISTVILEQFLKLEEACSWAGLVCV